jgi:CRISPR-associated endonuclease/helicase Cas3
MQTYWARINETVKQPLSEHLINVADLSAEFSICQNISRLAGFLHDFGKATSVFQKYLEDGGERGSVVHALQGAFFMDNIIGSSKGVEDVLIREIVALVVASHHGSLSDGVSPDGEVAFFQKFLEKDEEKYRYKETVRNITDVIPDFSNRINDLINAAKSDIIVVITLIKKTYTSCDSAAFALGLFVKYIVSCLVDADRLDAYLFDVKDDQYGRYKPADTDWGGLIATFEKHIQMLSGESKIAKIRQTISNLCKDAAAKNSGIYLLSVPTGGGKTFSSLRFALHHCRVKNKKRIIYVIPFLSIIEQTALELRKILELQEENDIILEHHSGIVPSDNDDEQRIRKLAISRWDKPIIITTMVQFLETVMSAKSGDLRKFHNMSDSVIIFDEIQSLPIKTIHLFNETVSFLAKICNATVLLCTATQPLLHKTERKNMLLENSPKLIDCDNLFADIKRTSIVVETEKDTDGFAAFVADKAEVNGNCLAIVNTKASARTIFKKLKDKCGFDVYHLSTFMCSEHRVKTFDKIKDALNHKRKFICVTTQLIEAGVDISFDCVVRAMAGLDSIAQAAGRCNRNGESDVPKEVYIIPLKDENLDKLPDIKVGKNVTERLIRENKNTDLLDPAIMEQFYKYYFYDRRNQMDYQVKEDKSVYNMLSSNSSGKKNFENKTGNKCQCNIAHAFRTAGEIFYVIDKNTESVVVMYGEAESFIEAYRKQPKNIITKDKLTIIRKLEKLSVALYSHEKKRLEDIGMLFVLDEELGTRCLYKNQYSDDIGVFFELNVDNFILN